MSSIQFVCGPSGSGKSSYIQNELIESSIRNPKRAHLLIVPDQFTMQTQLKMIRLHPNHAFSNIEVLSFSRLSHRILEEVGGEDIPVLDDTGKSLIIRRVAGDITRDLSVLASRLNRIGFIHEVKSVISEFMQYGISPDGARLMAKQAAECGKRALAAKLYDLETIYRAFMDYKSEHFITREETLDLVKISLHKSELIRDAYIAFDGFTGFTPIQERVIQELMVLAARVVFTFTLERGTDPHAAVSVEDLFYLSHISADRLMRLADEASVPEEQAVLLDGSYDRPDDLRHLERALFRYPTIISAKAPEHIHIYIAANIREEITDTFQRISGFISKRGYRYRDIAVVVGDMSSYAQDLQRTAESLNIPIYMDYNRSVLNSPFIEAIRSAYDVISSDYSCESVIRHLRCGFGPLDRNETDELENFLLMSGIRGRAAYERVWTLRAPAREEKSDEALKLRVEKAARLNDMRERVVKHFYSLHNKNRDSAHNTNHNVDYNTDHNADHNANNTTSYAHNLYDFMTSAHMYERLAAMADGFDADGDTATASEYRQIYGRVCELLDQIVGLCGDDFTDMEEFVNVLEAGFNEIRLGVIPKQSDEIMVGDIVRTRLTDVKALFLLGVNDSNIPGRASTGGLISDIEREYLSSIDGVDLAPTPREQMFTQRLYLYMNMTKPTDELVISYAASDDSGSGLLPSYLIQTLCKLYPALEILPSASTHMVDGVTVPADKTQIRTTLADMMREYSGGGLDAEAFSRLTDLSSALIAGGDRRGFTRIRDMSVIHYTHVPLGTETARLLYGTVMQTSVSRLERFAACAYAHFLSYGLRLFERPEYTLESADLGDIYHRALEEFAIKLRSEGIGWDGLSDDDAGRWVDDILEVIGTEYKDTILISSSRNIALMNRVRRVLKRSVDTIRYQVTRGYFVPTYFEKGFKTTRRITDDGGADISYTVTGKIDRVDLCETERGKYLRIVDYKSGNKDFDPTAFYHGLMLQLAVYMDCALKEVGGSEPAGMLYFHVADPIVDADGETDLESAAGRIRRELRMKGALSSDTDVLLLMDKELEPGTNSDIIPVGLKKDGTPNAYSKVYDREAFETLLKYAGHKMDALTMEILSGDISVCPSFMGKGAENMPCRFCEYSSVCNISSALPGYVGTGYKSESTDEILELMNREMRND